MRNQELALLLAFSGLCACSSAEQGEEVPVETAKTNEEILHRVSVGAETYTFMRFSPENSQPVVLLRIDAPMSVAESTVQRLYAKESQLTLLETFHALAPEGESPHPALVELHELSALANRAGDLTVRRVRVEPPRFVEKITAAQCSTLAKDSADPHTFGIFWNSGRVVVRNDISLVSICPQWLPSGGINGNCNADFTDIQYVAICNNGPGSMQSQVWWRYFDDETIGRFVFWNTGAAEDIAANNWRGWVFNDSSKAHNLMFRSLPINTPLPQLFHARSGAWGASIPLPPL